MERRDFLASGAALLAVGPSAPAQAQTIPFSHGTEPPKLKLPPLACDCHMHVYDGRFPTAASATIKPPDASVADYRKLQARLGSTRTIVVTPSTYGTDNRVSLEAIRVLGASARGVAVVDPDVTAAELKALAEGGIRGIRFNLTVGAFLTPAMVEPLARKIADLGWHIQLNASPDDLLALGDMLMTLPVPVVLDHLSRIPQPAGLSHPAYALVRKLLDKGQAWVKLSGPYITSNDGSADFRDAGAVASGFVKAAPERMLWGSDWPHPTKPDKPDDAALLDLVGAWAPDAETQRKIFVSNPAKLYGF